ncbi:MAG: hypothetical protein JWO30_4301 [Fibrobacteres bacterium]|nr:hypothetical protein [Fibrobacterota bacterium]
MPRQFRKAHCPRSRSGRATGLLSLIAWTLVAALAAQAAEPGHLPHPVDKDFSPEAQGPTVQDLRAAFPGRTLRQVDPLEFQRLALANARHGRLLTGPALAATLAASAPEPLKNAVPRADTVTQKLPKADSAADRASGVRREPESNSAARQDDFDRDSLLRQGARNSGGLYLPGDPEPRAHADSLIAGPGREADEDAEADHTAIEKDRAKGWFVNFFADVTDGGGGGWDAHELAAVIYVVIGVVVVGAFILYGAQTLYDLATNQEDYPVFMEAGVRVSYSGKALKDPDGGSDLYRDAYLAGLRFAIGLDKPGMGLGLTVEGGYIDVRLRGISDPSRSFDFEGGYLVAGPLLRFGGNDPFSFNLEFLNGTSDHASIGWISKSRMAVEAKVSPHTLIGAHLGAVFYDLHFLDGLGWRKGNFNRDLSLIYGLDAGWEF